MCLCQSVPHTLGHNWNATSPQIHSYLPLSFPQLNITLFVPFSLDFSFSNLIKQVLFACVFCLLPEQTSWEWVPTLFSCTTSKMSVLWLSQEVLIDSLKDWNICASYCLSIIYCSWMSLEQVHICHWQQKQKKKKNLGTRIDKLTQKQLLPITLLAYVLWCLLFPALHQR